MPREQQYTDIELARRIGFMLHCEEHKIFGRNLGGSFEQLIDRLLSAAASVDPPVYKLAYMLKHFLSKRSQA